jgi:peptidoglycan hydrolase CwlO-like protein
MCVYQIYKGMVQMIFGMALWQIIAIISMLVLFFTLHERRLHNDAEELEGRLKGLTSKKDKLQTQRITLDNMGLLIKSIQISSSDTGSIHAEQEKIEKEISTLNKKIAELKKSLSRQKTKAKFILNITKWGPISLLILLIGMLIVRSVSLFS